MIITKDSGFMVSFPLLIWAILPIFWEFDSPWSKWPLVSGKTDWKIKQTDATWCIGVWWTRPATQVRFEILGSGSQNFKSHLSDGCGPPYRSPPYPSYMTFCLVIFFLLSILVKSQTDIQNAMHMSPSCICTGGLKYNLWHRQLQLWLWSMIVTGIRSAP